MYYFQSPAHGPCRMEAKTSGKHGFGTPKTFIVTSLDPATPGAYTLWYKDDANNSSTNGDQIANFHLIMSAIAQFCSGGDDLRGHREEELRLHHTPFAGEVTNRYGRVVSATSFLPRRTESIMSDSS